QPEHHLSSGFRSHERAARLPDRELLPGRRLRRRGNGRVLLLTTNPPERSMKRFHVHAHVQDLKTSVAFYSKLFAAEPTRLESDYAKWMIEDPRINFAISTRGEKHWVTDPQGIAWEHFHTLDSIPTFSQPAVAKGSDAATACCGTAAPRG